MLPRYLDSFGAARLRECKLAVGLNDDKAIALHPGNRL
jgi:hypothetical protein